VPSVLLSGGATDRFGPLPQTRALKRRVGTRYECVAKFVILGGAPEYVSQQLALLLCHHVSAYRLAGQFANRRRRIIKETLAKGAIGGCPLDQHFVELTLISRDRIH